MPNIDLNRLTLASRSDLIQALMQSGTNNANIAMALKDHADNQDILLQAIKQMSVQTATVSASVENLSVPAVPDPRLLTSHGGIPNCVFVSDANMTLGSPQIVCPQSAPFLNGHVGQTICLDHTGQVGTIDQVISPSVAILSFSATANINSANAPNPVYGEQAAFGTDNAAAIDRAIASGGLIDLASGYFLTSRTMTIGSLRAIRSDGLANVAAGGIVFVGGSFLHIVSNPPGQPCFACDLENVNLITMGGAEQVIRAEIPTNGGWLGLSLNNFWGHSRWGIYANNAGNMRCEDTIITKCSEAAFKFTGPPQTAENTFNRANIFQCDRGFDISGIFAACVFENFYMEEVNICLNLDINEVTNTSLEGIRFKALDVLFGAGGYVKFPQPRLLKVTSSSTVSHATSIRGLRFLDCRVYAIPAPDGVTPVVDCLFEIDLRNEAHIFVFDVDLDDFLYSYVRSGVIQSTGAANGTKPKFYTNRVENSFGGTVPVVDPVFNQVDAFDVFRAGVGLEWAFDTLRVTRDPVVSVENAQQVWGNADFTRAVSLRVPTTAEGFYTAILRLYGQLGALAINGLLKVGSTEQPTSTLEVHDQISPIGQRHSQIKVQAGADDGPSNALINVVDKNNFAVFQVFADGTVSQGGAGVALKSYVDTLVANLQAQITAIHSGSPYPVIGGGGGTVTI